MTKRRKLLNTDFEEIKRKNLRNEAEMYHMLFLNFSDQGSLKNGRINRINLHIKSHGLLIFVSFIWKTLSEKIEEEKMTKKGCIEFAPRKKFWW